MIRKIILEQKSEDEIIEEVKRLLYQYVTLEKNLEYYEYSGNGRMKARNPNKVGAANRIYNKASKLFKSHFGSDGESSNNFIKLHREALKKFQDNEEQY